MIGNYCTHVGCRTTEPCRFARLTVAWRTAEAEGVCTVEVPRDFDGEDVRAALARDLRAPAAGITILDMDYAEDAPTKVVLE